MVKRPKIPPDKVKAVLKRFEDTALAPGDGALIREILLDAVRIGLEKGPYGESLREALKKLEEGSSE